MNQLMKFPETAFFEKKQNKIFNDVIRHIVVFVVGGWFLIVDFVIYFLFISRNLSQTQNFAISIV